MLRAQSLPGTLPKELVKFPYLQEIDLSRNFLNGTIPPEWGSIQLVNISLLGNRLTGSIPKELGNISTLISLSIEFNQLSEALPPEFGNLRHIERMLLSSNNFTGEVPETFAKLTTLKDFRISDNHLTRKIPNFIQNWTKLGKLAIQAGGLIGPIPSSISALEKLTDLYLWLNYRILRSCNLIGELPEYLGDMTNLKTLDLNFNKLSGEIPRSFSSLMDVDYLNLTRNLLTGSVPTWILEKGDNVDLSYNNFTAGSQGTSSCQQRTVSLFASTLRSNTSVGRRIFDIYLQGKLVQKDFNIEDEAGGVGKAVIKKCPAAVTNSTLEISFHWAGKGTTGIPVRGVYGSLISALSVNPDLKGLDLQTSSFRLRQIKAAPNNFDAANKIGEGGFGPVYKGLLADGTIIAVKQLTAKSKQGNREFLNEIGMISALQHPHLVKLFGCCIEGNQLLLIYEYMENNSLARALFGPEEFQLKLDWPTRRKICIGIARGLAYLHEESRLKIVHRDIKATNVLLDKNLNPKISDFGLAKLDEEDNTHISTRIAGTYGYMAPEYAMHGHLTDKADVYSFGIVALEIVSGMCNTKNRSKEESFYLLDRAQVLKKRGNLLDLVDPRIGSDYNIDEVMAMINVALLCTNPTAAARPSMPSVVRMLEGRVVVPEFFSDSSISANELNVEAMKKLYWKLEENDTDESQTKSILADRSGTTSTFVADPYPVNLTF
ncbi:hypothetical protein CRYUN_Cryun33cG0024100 [Craigia yunnanensis]